MYKNYYEKIIGKWIKTRLIDVGFITGGGTPKTENTEYWNGNVIWVTPADMSKKTKYIASSRKTITEKGLNESSACIIVENSIIMSSRAPIGYLLINLKPLSTSQGCKSFTRYTDNILNIEYVYYYLMSQIESIQKRSSGTTFKEISGKDFGLTEILIPPLKEQFKIVNKINHLFEKIDNLIY